MPQMYSFSEAVRFIACELGGRAGKWGHYNWFNFVNLSYPLWQLLNLNNKCLANNFGESNKLDSSCPTSLHNGLTNT